MTLSGSFSSGKWKSTGCQSCEAKAFIDTRNLKFHKFHRYTVIHVNFVGFFMGVWGRGSIQSQKNEYMDTYIAWTHARMIETRPMI